MLNSPLFKKFILLFIILSGMSFYTFFFIPERVVDAFKMISVSIMLVILVFDYVSNEPSKRIYYFKKEVNLIFLAVFLSMFMAEYYHNQRFFVTAIAQRSMYFYLIYYTLHALKVDYKELEGLILPLGFAYAGFYILQYIVFPFQLFDSRVEMDRGTVRAFIPGAGFMFLGFYKSLQVYVSERKFNSLLSLALFFVVGGILTGTRQSLATLVLMSTIFIFFNKQVKSRFFIITSAAIVGVAIFFMFYEYFIEIYNLTQQQKTSNKTNIRLLAINFFLNDFMGGPLAYVFGNGMDSMNAEYGMRVSYYKLILGFYQSDVGLIGDYSKYGVLFVLAQLSVMGKMLFGKLPDNLSYIRFFIASSALSMFSGANGFGRIDGIVFYCILMFLIEGYRNHKLTNKKELIA